MPDGASAPFEPVGVGVRRRPGGDALSGADETIGTGLSGMEGVRRADYTGRRWEPPVFALAVVPQAFASTCAHGTSARLTVRLRANENPPMAPNSSRVHAHRDRAALDSPGGVILCGFALGLLLKDLPLSPQTLRLYAFHKWIGITVLLLTVVRLGWRWAHPAPPPVAMPEWQRRAAAASHALLYVLMLVIPLSGWVYSSASGVQVVYLGLVPLPDLVAKDKALAAVLKAVHVTLNYGLLALVMVHAGAAIKHHVVDRDDVLRRMLPFRPRR